MTHGRQNEHRSKQEVIAKGDRYTTCNRNFSLSYSSIEQDVISALQPNIKNGLILAKAVRIASIARPAEDLISQCGLREDIRVDDCITSYMLKSCLMKLLKADELDAFRDTACSCSIKIYQELIKHFTTALQISWYEEWNFGCGKGICKVERDCCKRKKLILAMISQILRWLEQNKQQLNSIDFDN